MVWFDEDSRLNITQEYQDGHKQHARGRNDFGPLLAVSRRITFLLGIAPVIHFNFNHFVIINKLDVSDAMLTSEVTLIIIQNIHLHHGQSLKGHSHEYDSHPFIPEIHVFQSLTLKMQGQGHGCGQRWRSYDQASNGFTFFTSH